jgi:hypothetical protein
MRRRHPEGERHGKFEREPAAPYRQRDCRCGQRATGWYMSPTNW